MDDAWPTEEVEAVVGQIRPLLAGKPPQLQSAVLADLLAYWLAGHHCPGDIAATREVREVLLEHHLELVRILTRLNAGALGTTPGWMRKMKRRKKAKPDD